MTPAFLLFSRSRALWWTRSGYTPDMTRATRWGRVVADRLAATTPTGETLLVADPRAVECLKPLTVAMARRELLRLRLWIARTAGQVDGLAASVDPAAGARALAARMRAVAGEGANNDGASPLFKRWPGPWKELGCELDGRKRDEGPMTHG